MEYIDRLKSTKPPETKKLSFEIQSYGDESIECIQLISQAMEPYAKLSDKQKDTICAWFSVNYQPRTKYDGVYATV